MEGQRNTDDPSGLDLLAPQKKDAPILHVGTTVALRHWRGRGCIQIDKAQFMWASWMDSDLEFVLFRKWIRRLYPSESPYFDGWMETRWMHYTVSGVDMQESTQGLAHSI